MGEAAYAVAVVGGGINGCGIAREAAGRGLSVLLCEQGDLSSATSSASTKLIHGGLRYLEHFEFRLVRESLEERELLWGLAPHLVRPMRFVLPHSPALRPAWMLRTGLFLYDHLGGRKRLPGTRVLNLTKDAAGVPLRNGFKKAFEYSDCWVDDARLVVLTAVDAAERGASIRPYTRCVHAAREDGMWRLDLKDTVMGKTESVHARVLVNASGPWVSSFLHDAVKRETRHPIRKVKGSHIVVRRLFDHERAYVLQNDDERIAFAIPYEGDYTLIGTTDEEYKGDPAQVTISDEEIAYLCRLVNRYFRTEIGPQDVKYSYSGVRPLYDDGASKAQEATRDYVLELEAEGDLPPLLNVIGGKLTTYRRLAERVMDRLRGHLPTSGRAWTHRAPLPGGEFPADGVLVQVDDLRRAYPFLMAPHALRLVRAYGTRASRVLGDATSEDALGRRFGGDLYEAEVRYLMQHEWARCAADVLWRRSKLGLKFSAEETSGLDEWMQGQWPLAASL